MPFNTDQFRQEMAVPPASPAFFDVQFTKLPQKEFDLQEYKHLMFRCEESELPAIGIQPMFTRTYGPPVKNALDKQYDDLTMTFIISETMKEKEIFDRWSNFIIDEDSNDVRYYSDYIGEAIISQYSKTGHLIYQVKILDCWPSSINPVKLSWGSKNEYAKLQVNFSYYSWKRLLDARAVTQEPRPERRTIRDRIEDAGSQAVNSVKDRFNF